MREAMQTTADRSLRRCRVVGLSTGSETRVLVVDDDKSIRTTLERGLRLEGFEVLLAADGVSGLEIATDQSPDIIVLDVTMPGMNGVEVCRQLRLAGNEVPICMLSARDEVEDRVAGLKAGADDYLVKPFALAELEARIDALLRRSDARDGHDESVLVFGDLTVDIDARHVTRNGESIDVTRREFELLRTLVENAGVVLSRDRLLELVWGYDFETTTNVVDVFVGYLRRKTEIDGLPRIVHTVRGIGFVMRA